MKSFINLLKNKRNLHTNEGTAIYTNGILVNVIPESFDARDVRYIKSDNVIYDLLNMESIEEIPIPNPYLLKSGDVLSDIYYTLRLISGKYRNLNLKELSYACLRKSNELWLNSPWEFTEKEIMRIVRWLQEDGMFEEATKEKHNIISNKLYQYKNPANKQRLNEIVLKNIHELKTDYIEIPWKAGQCNQCSIYHGRIYSISGNDKRFPKIPSFIWNRFINGQSLIHDHCRCSVYPINMLMPSISYQNKYIKPIDDIIKLSNRPFIPDASLEDVENNKLYYKQLENEKQKDKDREEYYKLVYTIPLVVPKSFSSYRRMKNSNNKTFTHLKEEAQIHGISIS
ncbi:hypothetical protein [Anaerosporobacter faecicola]|uniref:hypothetical protein n=1 Tax=Anaerosporobacter faecicola TaxID=2718714 RepID=UPI001438F139|nr:hypothetical protein [Anaerosporobacter faecicola]